MSHKHLYHLEQSKSRKFTGGDLRGASANEFPILKGQGGALYSVRLEKGGVREPHWHPSAWEFDYCISGRARMTILSPQGELENFEVGEGDVAFVPQGHFHYFENIGAGELHFLVAFNSELGEGDDDIGIAASISILPPSVLAAIFKVPEETFLPFSKTDDRLVMVKKV
jgi:oxalate decarboxylase